MKKILKKYTNILKTKISLQKWKNKLLRGYQTKSNFYWKKQEIKYEETMV